MNKHKVNTTQPSLPVTVVPHTILFQTDLTFIQVGMLSQINYLQGHHNKKWCFASNRYFSRIFKITTRAITNNINVLIDLGFLKVHRPNHQTRLLKTTKIFNKLLKTKPLMNQLHTPHEITSNRKNNINNCFSKEKQSGFFQKPPIVPINKIKKKRKLIKLPDTNLKFTIDYWNNIGKPFSKVIKKEPVEKLLIPLLKKNDHRTICEVFDKGYKYFSDPYFIAPNKAIRCADFFKNNSYSYIGKWMDGNKMNNWFDIFFKKSDNWLEQNLLRLPKDTAGYNKDFYNEICRILSIAPQDRDTQLAIKRTCNRISDWLGANNTDTLQWPLLNDFEYFIRDNYPDTRKVQPYWFSGRAFWNRQFNDYLVQTGRFSHISEIKRI